MNLTEYQEKLFNYNISNEEYFNNGKTTVVILTMNNGFDVVGESACVDKIYFDEEIGKHHALVDALKKVEAFVGYERQQKKYEEKLRMYDYPDTVVMDENSKLIKKIVVDTIKERDKEAFAQVTRDLRRSVDNFTGKAF